MCRIFIVQVDNCLQGYTSPSPPSLHRAGGRLRAELPPPPSHSLSTPQVDDCVQGYGFSTAAILRAFDYAHQMGAHIVSCSFGPTINAYTAPAAPADVPGTPWYDPSQATSQKLYISAMTVRQRRC